MALAFAHFSSELLLEEQIIIPVKKTLNNASQIDAKLIDQKPCKIKMAAQIPRLKVSDVLQGFV